MKVSKDIILDTARKLFNQRGLSAVTARGISGKLNISPGSFSYHFPDKSRLIIELYRAMSTEMNACLQTLQSDEISIKPLLDTFQKCAYVQLKYKFFFLNLFGILINYPAIKLIHKKALANERFLAKQLFKNYLVTGIIIKSATKQDLKFILKQSQILFAYWVMDAELREFKSDDQAVWYYTEVCTSHIKPFLTKKLKIEFESYFKNKNK